MYAKITIDIAQDISVGDVTAMFNDIEERYDYAIKKIDTKIIEDEPRPTSNENYVLVWVILLGGK